MRWLLSSCLAFGLVTQACDKRMRSVPAPSASSVCGENGQLLASTSDVSALGFSARDAFAALGSTHDTTIKVSCRAGEPCAFEDARLGVQLSLEEGQICVRVDCSGHPPGWESWTSAERLKSCGRALGIPITLALATDRNAFKRSMHATMAVRTKHQASLDYSETVPESLRPAWLSLPMGQTLQLSVHVAFDSATTHGVVELVSTSNDDAGGLYGRPELSLQW